MTEQIVFGQIIGKFVQNGDSAIILHYFEPEV